MDTLFITTGLLTVLSIKHIDTLLFITAGLLTVLSIKHFNTLFIITGQLTALSIKHINKLFITTAPRSNTGKISSYDMMGHFRDNFTGQITQPTVL